MISVAESGHPASEVVSLNFVAHADLLVLARLTAATVAARAGLSVEEIDDLCLAVDELCQPLVRNASGGSLELRYARNDDSVEISCTLLDRFRDGAPGPWLEPPYPDDLLSTRVLDALVDQHGWTTTSGDPQKWLRKRRLQVQDR